LRKKDIMYAQTDSLLSRIGLRNPQFAHLIFIDETQKCFGGSYSCADSEKSRDRGKCHRSRGSESKPTRRGYQFLPVCEMAFPGHHPPHPKASSLLNRIVARFSDQKRGDGRNHPQSAPMKPCSSWLWPLPSLGWLAFWTGPFLPASWLERLSLPLS